MVRFFRAAYKPEISAIALIENVGFGGTHAAPTVRAIYDEFYRKTRHQEPPGALMPRNKGEQNTFTDTWYSRAC
ncbi:MAG: hypothetical protein WKF30_12530 [Pyrinomonadaceae bacterium]